jgi:hypothetical protein
MLKKILLAVAVLIVIFVGVVITRPDTFHVERTLNIGAPDDVIYAHLDDFHAWADWSPWEKLDPNMKKTFSGPERGIGATYQWQGNDKVGTGKMTITESSPSSAMRINLEFIEPFKSEAVTGFEIAPRDEHTNDVTWWMDGNNDFMGKAFSLFMDMDAMIGADYMKGLTALKAVSEAEAKKRAAEAQAAEAARPSAPAGDQAQPAAPEGTSVEAHTP